MLTTKIFKLKAPQDWHVIEKKGDPSYWGYLTNGIDSLQFDYAWYDVVLEQDFGKHQLYARDTVNGLVADMLIPDNDGQGYISMHLNIREKTKFTIWGNKISSTKTILQIFKSFIFENSDTLNNRTIERSKFTTAPSVSPKTFLINNCSQCHQLYNITFSPPLSNIIEKRSAGWIYTFLTNRSLIYKDKTYSKPKDNLICPTFPELTKNETILLIDYIKSKMGPVY